MRVSNRDGVAIAEQDFGGGERRVLAIHCTLAHSGAWAGIGAELGDLATITAFDMPSHGRSGDWEGQTDFIAQVTRIAASYFEAPMDLIGHSAGAVAALQLAIAAPVVVRSLTLIEPVLFAAITDGPDWSGHVAEMAPFTRAMEAYDRETAAREFNGLMGMGAWDDIDPRRRQYLTDRIHMIAAGAPALYEDSGKILAEGALEVLVMPVMLIRGEASLPSIRSVGDALAARLPDVGVADVPGAGHMLPITHPKQVAGLIEVNMTR
jgi:pimeloyl-ACP methyl ester carboxylesterase